MMKFEPMTPARLRKLAGLYQPYTTDCTPRGLLIARNAMRLRLWADDTWFVHRWLCHPGEDCKDGCDVMGDPGRIVLYQSELETEAGDAS